jgi:hypothetical protein
VAGLAKALAALMAIARCVARTLYKSNSKEA